jgi:ribonuclease P protein component
VTGGFTFRKKERLCGQTAVEGLFDKGNTISAYPFKMLYILHTKPEDYPVRVLITIPRKKFKKATDRNRIRRKIKEAYRLNKYMLLDTFIPSGLKIYLGIVYIGKESNPSFLALKRDLIRSFTRLLKNLDSVESSVTDR